jgi:hypothetical protein
VECYADDALVVAEITVFELARVSAFVGWSTRA